jgi:hypothetical protein
VVIFGISLAKPEAVLFFIFLEYLRMCFLFRSCYFLEALEACLGECWEERFEARPPPAE